MRTRQVSIATGTPGRVPATFRDGGGEVALVLAPGAGGRRDGPLLAAFAAGLTTRGISTLAFDFPYRAAGKRFPDPPEVRAACYRAVTAWMTERVGARPFVGGHSMGGRAASACATAGMECAGLVLLGYPLYPVGKRGQRDAWRVAELPASGPGEHLPLLLLTGTRDELCDLDDLRGVLEPIGKRARLHAVDGADHSFDVLQKSGRTHADVMKELVGTAAGWIEEVRG
jgi:hypothetical protein